MRCQNDKHLLVPIGFYKFTKMYSYWNVLKGARTFSKGSGKSHYDELGVTPASTQADIKSAYYKLSMRYHPDKSTDEGAKKKFRAITDAYEVLGNVRLKKLYDKGLLGRAPLPDPPQKETEPTDPTLKFYQSREKRHVPPTMDGTNPIYDFDAWTKNHYGTLFEKKQREHGEMMSRNYRRRGFAKADNDGFVYTTVVFFMIITFLFMLDKPSYDIDEREMREKKDKKGT